jgi:NAD(P)-dependent dehydrogenase (short-subunit alcohol dehydrogenase family)
MTGTLTALVTGASSGLGRAIATRLAEQGYRVFGTSRAEPPNAIAGLEMLTLDVCRDDSVCRCVDQVLATTGQIDLLVNNAGTLLIGPAEESSLDQDRAIFEANFFGAVRLTNAVLPAMRERRQGRIINVSSMAGLVAFPGGAFYAASKFALEGYSEALHHELAPLGIKVSLIEPGFFRTKIYATPVRASRRIADYEKLRSAIEGSITEGLAAGADPDKVGRLVARIAQAKLPRLRYRVGADAHWLPRAKLLLPQWLWDRQVRRVFKY